MNSRWFKNEQKKEPDARALLRKTPTWYFILSTNSNSSRNNRIAHEMSERFPKRETVAFWLDWCRITAAILTEIGERRSK